MSIIPLDVVNDIHSIKHKYPAKYQKYITIEGVLTQIYNQLNNSNDIIIISVLKEIVLNDCNVWELKDYYINKKEYHYTNNDITANKRMLKCQKEA